MKWLKHLYTGESVSGKERKLKWKINHNAGTINIYVIAFASNKENLLDIIPATELMQKAYPKKNMHIIGLAKGYDEALELVRDIIEETYAATGDVDVWKYLKENRRNETK